METHPPYSPLYTELGGVRKNYASDFNDYDGDIIVPAVCFGGLNERLRGVGEIIGVFGDDLQDIVIGDFVSEAVGAQQVDIVFLERGGENVGFNLRVSSQGAGDDIFIWEAVDIPLCFEPAGVDEFLDKRVVVGNLRDAVLMDFVGARIAKIDDVGGIVLDDEGDERCAHALSFGIFEGILEDIPVCFVVCGEDDVCMGVWEDVIEEVPCGVLGIFLDSIDGDSAGDFACRMSAHAVCDGVDARVMQDFEAVFILRAHASFIGGAGRLDAGIRRFMLRFGGVRGEACRGDEDGGCGGGKFFSVKFHGSPLLDGAA